MNLEFLIVGQGLVGTNLAIHLWKMGRSFQIIDAGLDKAASSVSAGLLNPVTGPRLALSWLAGSHLQAAGDFYRECEQLLDQKFYTERTILRVLRSAAERERWQQRITDPSYDAFLSPLLDAVEGLPTNEHGFCRIQRAASIEPEIYLQAARKWFLNHSLLRVETLDPATLKPETSCVRWHGGSAKAVIFCEGWRAMHNPCFDFLPLEPAKGEIIRLRSQEQIPHEIINSGKWIVPLTGEVRVGSTFRPGDISHTFDPAAAKDLARKTRQILGWRDNGKLVAQQSGIRPCSRDKIPFLGRHPRWPCLAVANGFGAKGALTSPLCTQRLARHLVAGEPLLPEEDVSRWLPK